MGKLLLSIFLVTVYQCYGHYPPRRTLRAQDDAALGLAHSVVRSISKDFGWNFGGQLQTSQDDSEPDVVIKIIVYQSGEKNREPPSDQRCGPHHGLLSPKPPPQPSVPRDTSDRDYQFWYHKMYQNQYGYERPSFHNRPYNYDNYGDRYFENQNSENNPGYENFDTQTDKQPWVQNEGNNQFNEVQRPTQLDQRPPNYVTPVFGNPNQFNQNNQWYPNNMNQGIKSYQQPPNNEGIVSGAQNPINNNPNDVITQFPANPNLPTDTGMESENKKPDEEEEEFKIDVRFKGD